MSTTGRFGRREALGLVAATAGLMVLPRTAGADAARHEHADAGPGIGIPEALRAEHDELHAELIALTKGNGKTAEAARAVASALHPHFVKEEKLAMPPLGLLPALAAGEVRPDMAGVVQLTDALERDLPTMLKEHRDIVRALGALSAAGKQENVPEAQRFAEKLEQHAKTEEQVLYPAAVVVGKYVKLALAK